MLSSRLRYLPLLLASGSAVLLAQTTGAVQGHVRDPKGHPVIGAKVVLAGAGLQGGRTTVTDEDGAFRFGLVPPGPCTLTATREGLNAAKAQVQVGLDKTATVDLAMNAVAAAVVEVLESAAAVDLKATTVGGNYTPETLSALNVSRDYANIALLVPGVSQDNAGFKVYGATGAENNYVVDGVNATNVEFGTKGKNVPMEFIQEFQVKTGGYEAEYGKAMGGIINVITKSGGNEFTGDVFAYSEGAFLKTGNKHQNDGNLSKPLLLEDKTFEIGFDVGGAIIKDKLWYFVAYDRRRENQKLQIRLAPNAGDLAPKDATRDLFSAKLTWKLTEGQSLIASVVGDPETITGAAKTPQGSLGTWEGKSEVGGTDLSLRYEVTGDRWFGQFQVSRHEETNSVLPGSGGDQIQLVDQLNGGVQSGGFGRWDDKKFTRDNITGSVTGFLGNHEVKAGFDLQTDNADIHRGYTGGQQVTRLQTSPGGDIYSHYWWTTADATVSPFNAPSIVFASKPKHQSQAYFAQDKWTVIPALTLNLGVRLDQTDIKDQFGNTVVSLKDQWSPRVGFIWDFRGKGQDKLYGSFSRYYEQIPLDLVIRSFSVERNPTTYNFSPTDLTPSTAAEGYVGTASSIVGSYVEPVDTNLKGSYTDEFILGVETTYRSLYTFGGKFIRRYLGRAIEDGLDVTSPLGDYFIMNPGQSSPAGVTYPQAIRDYRGVELTAERKFADHYNWQFSYLWSQLKGNYEGAYQGIGGIDGTGQLDPNINSAFDLPEFIVNSYGNLSGDRKHQVKANGSYQWDSGWSLGATLTYQTGTPISRLGYHDGYGRYELFLTPRGTEGRTPDTTRLDTSLAYQMKLAGKNRVRIVLEVTNLLDSQTATVIDQRYNFAQSDVGQTNSNYRGPFDFQAPRSVRLGVRYSF
ncbi:membrane protein [Geothrix rubra]|uniref:Membrane protein n=1 Tax=Geothrix rubra TaxID=2927977 RepID=A0ABQ5Q6M1_9BACT|nr:TonB-dependent receptor [Geothrix rubra]GLH70056.1 membrane protein [Geothrix rubra]